MSGWLLLEKHSCHLWRHFEINQFYPKPSTRIASLAARVPPPHRSRAMADKAPKPKCSNCGKSPAKLMKCSGCKDNRDCVRYCDRKCQKKHYKDHKEDCRLCTVKLQADDAYAAYSREYAAADREQRAGEFQKHLAHMELAVEYAEKAVARYEQLGPRSTGMQLELNANIALGHGRHVRFEKAHAYIQRGFDALVIAKAQDVSVDVYWAHMGKTISGEGGGNVKDPVSGATRSTKKGWNKMVEACESYLWTSKNQIMLSQLREGLIELPCGVCLEPMTGCKRKDDPKFERHEILPCKHMCHLPCLPAGYVRSNPPGYTPPGSPTDIGLCKYCVQVGQVNGEQGQSFGEVEELKKQEDARFEREKTERKLSKALGGIDMYEAIAAANPIGGDADKALMANLFGEIVPKLQAMSVDERKKTYKLMEKHMYAMHAENGLSEEKTSEMRRMILEGKDVLSEGPDKDAYDALWKDLEKEKRPAEIIPPLINRDRPSDV